jgi:nitroimidazol reductase NimA-like FMN-containing flavoprotein (pyridoxamine 5'-phosphate oxidase superfamily)
MIDNWQPYIVPLSFGYELNNNQLVLYFHSAFEGRKIEILKVKPYVCFEMDCSFKKIENEMACDWSAQYQSVIGYGNVSFLDNNEERKAALNCIMKRYGFQGTPSYNDNMLMHTAVYKLVVESMTAKQKL